jgi:hypothetical protein
MDTERTSRQNRSEEIAKEVRKRFTHYEHIAARVCMRATIRDASNQCRLDYVTGKVCHLESSREGVF